MDTRAYIRRKSSVTVPIREHQITWFSSDMMPCAFAIENVRENFLNLFSGYNYEGLWLEWNYCLEFCLWWSNKENANEIHILGWTIWTVQIQTYLLGLALVDRSFSHCRQLKSNTFKGWISLKDRSLPQVSRCTVFYKISFIFDNP